MRQRHSHSASIPAPRRTTARRMLAALLLVTAPAMAQQKPAGLPGAYPAKPVRVIISSVPGGGADFLGRLVFSKLGPLWGATFNAENLATGVGGILAMETTLKAPADGYTLLVTSSSSYINAAFVAPVSWDVRKVFAPISPMTLSTLLVGVAANTPYHNLKEMIAYAKAHPGEITFGVPGIGSSPHLTGELMQHMAGFKMTVVPYKGTGQAVIDTLAGRVPAIIGSVTALTPHVRAGKIKLIGVTSTTRVPSAPEFITLNEAGLTGYDYSGWFGIVGHGNLPPQLVNALNQGITQVINQPDTQAAMLKNGADPMTGTPEQFRATILNALVRTEAVLKATGLKLE